MHKTILNLNEIKKEIYSKNLENEFSGQIIAVTKTFSIEHISHLIDNLEAVITDLKKAKPSTSKGTYIKSISLSTTMGPGIRVDENSVASVN